eukprot:2104699-Pyramimonas_sp.AAC.1
MASSHFRVGRSVSVLRWSGPWEERGQTSVCPRARRHSPNSSAAGRLSASGFALATSLLQRAK